MILTAVFAKDVGAIHGDFTTLYYHLLTLLIVGIFTFGGSWIIYKIVSNITRMRVSQEEERIGLDLSQHAETMEMRLPSHN